MSHQRERENGEERGKGDGSKKEKGHGRTLAASS
jgi:hypothetical protein